MSYSAKYIKLFSLTLIFSVFLLSSCKQEKGKNTPAGQDSTQISKLDEENMPNNQAARVRIGAEVLFEDELGELSGKRVAVVGNQTSRFFNGTHLVDSLLSRGVTVVKVFAPEHGFRGTADAGEYVKDGTDTKTGLPIISLYGKNKKPSDEQLEGLDVVLFDIQDVGVRLYTYISTMTYVMEACEANGVAMWVLDRPNPNGWYVDGPVLKKDYSSFIGLHEIPVVHGMTLGEYALMVQGTEKFGGYDKLNLKVSLCEGYSHDMKWEETGWPWRAPSPNLASVRSAYLYPALVMFEPTPISVGRGTDSAFTIMGSPWFKPKEDYRQAQARLVKPIVIKGQETFFVPRSLPGKSKYPKFQDERCEGLSLQVYDSGEELFLAGLTLFQKAYSNFEMMHASEPFFRKNFNRWPGYSGFKQDIIKGKTAKEIYDSWQQEVEDFKRTRASFLLYSLSQQNSI